MRITGSLLAIGLALSGALAPATPAAGATGAPSPITLAVIAPVTAPPTLAGVLDEPTLEELTTPGGLLAMQLGQLGGREVTLAIDPMIIASIRALGSSVPDAAASWLTRLADTPNESFALQWADADPALSLQASGAVLDAPELLLDPALFAAEGADSVPTAPGDPVIPTLLSQGELVEWDHSHPDIAWPGDHTLVETDLAAIQAHGFTAAIINSQDIPAARVKSPHLALGAVDGIVSNDVISNLIRAAIAAPTDEEWALSFDALTNALAQLSAEGERVLAATLARIDPLSPLRMSQTLDALHGLDWVELAPLSTVFDQPAVSSGFTPEERTSERTGTIEALHRAEADVISFSNVVDDPAPLLSTRRAKLLALLSSGWGPDDRLWQVGAAQYLEECAGILGAVTIQDSSTINLLAENGPFPVTVRNDLAHAVTVYITVRPDRAILNVTDSRVELSIPANTQAKALVPVQVVANGALTTTVTLSSADGTRIASPTHVDLNVQAGWEGPVTIIMVSLVALMLLAGIWRTVRSSRQSAARTAQPPRAIEVEGSE